MFNSFFRPSLQPNKSLRTFFGPFRFFFEICQKYFRFFLIEERRLDRPGDSSGLQFSRLAFDLFALQVRVFKSFFSDFLLCFLILGSHFRWLSLFAFNFILLFTLCLVFMPLWFNSMLFSDFMIYEWRCRSKDADYEICLKIMIISICCV